MSPALRTASWIERQSEVPFEDADIFFSRTDTAGRICSGNDVFERVSGYGWDELLGAPHKIIRHADTPRAAFYVLWREIQGGRPVRAYVKNRSKTGGYYWVFAIVSPVADGFLSVRLKPASPLFDRVRDLYHQATARETALKPAESFDQLALGLQGLGLGSYRTFMSQGLGQELVERDRRMGRRPPARLENLVSLQALAISNIEQTQAIQSAYAISRHLPLSLQVQAARLGPQAVTVTTIASNYRAIVEELAESMAEFSAAALAVEQAVSDALFLLGAARLQCEMARRFRAESPSSSDRRAQTEHDLALLDRLAADYETRAREGITLIAPSVSRFEDACADMKRLAAGLEVTRIVGKMESARLIGENAGLDGLLQDLGAFQQSISLGLNALAKQSRTIASGLREASEAIAAT